MHLWRHVFMVDQPRTMFEKIWEAHAVRESAEQWPLLFIDRHLVHEATSPQAFEGLRLSGRRVRRPDLTFAVLDHNVAPRPRVVANDRRSLAIFDDSSREQVSTLEENARA